MSFDDNASFDLFNWMFVNLLVTHGERWRNNSEVGSPSHISLKTIRMTYQFVDVEGDAVGVVSHGGALVLGQRDLLAHDGISHQILISYVLGGEQTVTVNSEDEGGLRGGGLKIEMSIILVY